MENNLRDRITEIVERLKVRIEQLDRHAKEYESEGNLESHYSCNIRKVTLQVVLNSLQTALYETK